MMTFRAVFFLSLGLLSLPLAGQQTPPSPKAKPANVLAPVPDVPGLPRVLIIGDSISMGYTTPVRKLLEGKANVHRIPQNGGPSKNGVARLDAWLGTSKWDVIHFNHGIHDAKVMPDGRHQVELAEYEANLRAIVVKLKATGARLIFALTTPIPPSPLKGSRNFGDEKQYNAVAAKVMEDNGIAINDLHSYMLPRFSELQIPDDLHYKQEGYTFLAQRVAKSIEAALKTQG